METATARNCRRPITVNIKNIAYFFLLLAAIASLGAGFFLSSRALVFLDMNRLACKAALAVAPDSPLLINVSRSAGSTDSSWSWDLLLTKRSESNVYVLLEEINPEIIDGGRSMFFMMEEEERILRTVESQHGSISFDPKVSYGVLPDNWAPSEDSRYRFHYPVSGGGRISQADGRSSYFDRTTHDGSMRYAVDIVAEIGTDIFNGRDGVVVDIADKHSDAGCNLEELVGKANRVIILHDDGTQANYGHLMQNSITVELGQRVRAGEVIAKIGNSGKSRRPHLHFEVGGLTPHGYMTMPLIFYGCEGEKEFIPRIGKVDCLL